MKIVTLLLLIAFIVLMFGIRMGYRIHKDKE
jgi:hypothetical protein